jgi:hypothetical protein
MAGMDRSRQVAKRSAQNPLVQRTSFKPIAVTAAWGLTCVLVKSEANATDAANAITDNKANILEILNTLVPHRIPNENVQLQY